MKLSMAKAMLAATQGLLCESVVPPNMAEETRATIWVRVETTDIGVQSGAYVNFCASVETADGTLTVTQRKVILH
jgi:hypothetical protein